MNVPLAQRRVTHLIVIIVGHCVEVVACPQHLPRYLLLDNLATRRSAFSSVLLVKCEICCWPLLVIPMKIACPPGGNISLVALTYISVGGCTVCSAVYGPGTICRSTMEISGLPSSQLSLPGRVKAVLMLAPIFRRLGLSTTHLYRLQEKRWNDECNALQYDFLNQREKCTMRKLIQHRSLAYPTCRMTFNRFLSFIPETVDNLLCTLRAPVSGSDRVH
jgi:hypothetical protein